MSELSYATIADFVARALAEDIGRGDLTTEVTVGPTRRATGQIEFRTGGVVCGLPIAEAIFRALDPGATFETLAPEGTALEGPAVAMRVTCSTRALLTGERVALNIIGRLAGTATLTRSFVERVAGTRAQILDTRKTTPLLRALEKYAVRIGGARNHRRGLDDGVLIKDNHIALAGGVGAAVAQAKQLAPPGIKIEAEVETIDQLREALAAGADMLLLDNMPLDRMREAVIITAGRVPLEASGGVRLETTRAIAETGVDFISAGALTHSAGCVDVALEIVLEDRGGEVVA